MSKRWYYVLVCAAPMVLTACETGSHYYDGSSDAAVREREIRAIEIYNGAPYPRNSTSAVPSYPNTRGSVAPALMEGI